MFVNLRARILAASILASAMVFLQVSAAWGWARCKADLPGCKSIEVGMGGCQLICATPFKGGHTTSSFFWLDPVGGFDLGGWQYDAEPLSPTFGRVRVNCIHADSRGVYWSDPTPAYLLVP